MKQFTTLRLMLAITRHKIVQITLAAVLLLAYAPFATAQSFQNTANLMATQQRMMNVAPDMGEGAGSEIVGYHGGIKFGGMSQTEVNAFLSSPRNWFNNVGKGGSPFTKPITLDNYAKVLSPQDEEAYRKIFAAIGQNNLQALEALQLQVQDPLLLGHVEAVQLLRPDAQPTQDKLANWLKNYSDLPEADEIYAKSKKLYPTSIAMCTKPVTNPVFGGSVERADGGGTIEWNASGILTVASKGKTGGSLSKLLRAGKINDAIQWIEKQKAENQLNESQEIASKYAVAEILMRSGNADKAWPLIRDSDISTAGFDTGATNYALWIKGIIAWTQESYMQSFEAFKQLAAQNLPAPNKAAASFWAARAAEKVGLTSEMNSNMAIAATYSRTFYGLLAINRSKASPHYNWNVPNFDKATAEAFKKDLTGRRALALLQLGERSLAQAELRDMPVGQSAVLKNGLLALANRYALPSLSVQVGSAFGAKYDAALYPLIPWQPENGYTADPALVLAIAKNESHFNHGAVSPAGATGLMQIMPQTAEMMRGGSSKNLGDPELNVTLGDHYLEMLTRTDGIDKNLLFIIGSYNAGPKRILELYNAGKRQNGDDPLLFIETLPIKETRDYMQKVMATYWVYRARFNKPLTAMAELTVGRWPTYNRGDLSLTMNDKAEK
ncbi:MAG: lytic transglycosylase domain-containing protein [Alphaproteobacteria bacterium]|nr:lytic transglycosylase domain-containing protein [Alphaproteobacteria bacterium]